MTNLSQFLLIGFPIPKTVGKNPERYHWQGLKLHDLKGGKVGKHGRVKQKHLPALRIHRKIVLNDALPLEWLTSENWYPDQIRSRGTLPAQITEKNILVLGGGAIGSALTELLVRGGADQLTIIDSDEVKVGNLVRHTLGLNQVDTRKTQALANHLNQISPYAQVKHFHEDILSLSQETEGEIRKATLVFDCTGSDDALSALSNLEFEGETIFFSLCVNLGGQRLYLYSNKGSHFNNQDFLTKSDPWLLDDEKNREGYEMPTEGIGGVGIPYFRLGPTTYGY